MSTDMIRFDVLVQEALRGVVRKVLAEVARAGLPGEHHFYLTFDTTHPGVRVSARVKARYPEEMTIVLQHQFWDLNVTETGFDALPDEVRDDNYRQNESGWEEQVRNVKAHVGG